MNTVAKSGTSIITNPAVVRSALQQGDKSKNNNNNNNNIGSPRKLRLKNKENGKDNINVKKENGKLEAEGVAAVKLTDNQNGQVVSNTSSKSKKSKPKPKITTAATTTATSDLLDRMKISPATPKKKNAGKDLKKSSSEEDLKKILYPDLFGDSPNPIKHSHSLKSQKLSKNSNSSDPQLSSSPGNRFAGSSFHSSPAPSALPKPTFNISTNASASLPAGSSLFDQFMQADRQERLSKQQDLNTV
jgi:hypothetical protein